MNWTKTRIAITAGAMLALAACQTPGTVVVDSPPFPERGIPVAEAPMGSPIDGRWVDDNGGFTAVFDRGEFYSRSTRNGQVLTEGSYAMRRGSVMLDWVSLARQQRVQARCRFAGPNRLLCSQPGTNGFSLSRA